ncbi:response regulator [Pseudomonas aeruginosa]|nr:response regulator [Pseudomonas aeruginosa]
MRRVVRRYLPQAAVSEAGSFDEVLRLASSVSPEPPALFLLDLLLPGFAASQSIERLRRAYRHSAIVIVSMLDDPRLVDEVLAAGADGYLGNPWRPGRSARRCRRSAAANRWCACAAGRAPAVGNAPPGRPDPTAASGTAADRRWPVEQGNRPRAVDLSVHRARAFPRCCAPWK